MTVTLLLTFKIIHDFSAALWVGSVIFNYFLLRPAVTLIPAAHGVVVLQRVGTVFLYVGWAALLLLFASGVLRLYVSNQLESVLSLEFLGHSQGRSLAIMLFFWLVTVINVAFISFVLRPKLIQKLAVSSNPTLADVEKRRAAQIAASKWLDQINLINVFTSTLALIAGGSIAYGGLF
jgi:uncharacterized membrane protein